MPRIVYLAFPTGAVSGGQKMILRHVEALNQLGFEAIWWRNHDKNALPWLDFDVPSEVATRFRPDDIIVVPSDAPNAIRALGRDGFRTVIFEQNQFAFANISLESMEAFSADKFPTFIAVGQINATTIRRAYPDARVEIIPCFADERVFKPGVAAPALRISHVPRKREMEARVIAGLLGKFHPRHAGLAWNPIVGASEAQVAATFADSALYLSLPRFESVGMTVLEAMACGCVCAGFTGIGGRQFSTPDNGFWVEEDDCEAAVDALAQAADLVATGGPALDHMRQAAIATAEQWSYARFLAALEAVWEKLAPETRIRRIK